MLAASAALAAPVAGLLGHRRVKQLRNAGLMRIDRPNGIDEQGFVRIGGIEQWISVRGEDLANPVLLEIHGGPGSSNAAFGPRTRAWEKHFTVVRWDQRGAGKTLARSGAEGQGELSIARLHEDAVEVTEYVRTRLGVERVVLTAHSFGSVIGLRLARQRPDLFSAYVGTDQNLLDGGRDRSAHHALLDRLRTAGKRKDLAAVERLGTDPGTWTAEQYSTYARITATSEPRTADALKRVVLASLWFSPLHGLRDFGVLGEGMKLSAQIVPETAGYDDWADGTVFDLPFFVFQGEHDPYTPPALARRFVADVQAPVKDFALIPDAGHFAAFRYPDRFLELMLAKVRPVVTDRRPVAAR
ncbi:alpha/beta hydrolase [Kitasatospora sp. CM 4170]|uniref:alpha/beta fold hydrolase n=1 Tax=Kitasatospora sp. CM 4170 TaxID=3075627 RepID=UPI0028AA51BE|nr:alpha/beta hydrolase [Kitasatospora sp. CM 4170]WNM47433.1 alpha/beta hydrolase [Kitasatospora sp. CM 4170]